MEISKRESVRKDRAAMTREELLRAVWLLDDVIDSMRWIPVEEGLPGESNYYCVTTVDVETDSRIEQTIWFAHKDDYGIDESEWRELADYEKVIAWRKSSPYQK